MKITIDTQQESKEHMQHLIQLLQKILENRPPQNSTINDPQPGVFNMFKSDDGPEPQPKIELDQPEIVPY